MGSTARASGSPPSMCGSSSPLSTERDAFVTVNRWSSPVCEKDVRGLVRAILLRAKSLYSWQMATEQPVSASAAPPLAVQTQGFDRSLQAGPSYTIGRDPQSDIVISDDRVSWQHAVLRHEDGCWVLEDSGSTNGTYLGSERVNRVVLSGNRTVRLGHPVDGPVMTCSAGANDVRPPTAVVAIPPASPFRPRRAPFRPRRDPFRPRRDRSRPAACPPGGSASPA